MKRYTLVNDIRTVEMKSTGKAILCFFGEKSGGVYRGRGGTETLGRTRDITVTLCTEGGITQTSC